MARIGSNGCPRCQGFVAKTDDSLVCLNCGWRGYPAYHSEVLKPFSKEEIKEIVEEFGPPIEGLFEETHVDPVFRRKTMARETARKAVRNGGRIVRKAQRRHALAWPDYQPSVKCCLC